MNGSMVLEEEQLIRTRKAIGIFGLAWIAEELVAKYKSLVDFKEVIGNGNVIVKLLDGTTLYLHKRTPKLIELPE